MWYWRPKQSRKFAAAVVVVLDLTLLAVILFVVFGRSHDSPTTQHRMTRVSTKATTATNRPTNSNANVNYRPLRVRPPQTAVEGAVNQSMVENSSQASAALSGWSCPQPATSGTFPAISTVDSQSATSYALAFAQELLDIDFAASTRDGLLAWAQYNNAPDTLSGLSWSLATKVLFASLSARPSPVATGAQWKHFAAAKNTWRVSGLVVSVNPTWTQALSSGWTSVDPLLVIDDVSGALTITTPGHPSVVESISFALTLGGASLHSGYGVVALDYWTVN